MIRSQNYNICVFFPKFLEKRCLDAPSILPLDVFVTAESEVVVELNILGIVDELQGQLVVDVWVSIAHLSNKWGFRLAATNWHKTNFLCTISEIKLDNVIIEEVETKDPFVCYFVVPHELNGALCIILLKPLLFWNCVSKSFNLKFDVLCTVELIICACKSLKFFISIEIAKTKLS